MFSKNIESSSESFHSNNRNENSNHYEDSDKQNFDNSSVNDTADEENVYDDASSDIKKLSEKMYTLKKWALYYYNLQKKVYQKSKEVAKRFEVDQVFQS